LGTLPGSAGRSPGLNKRREHATEAIPVAGYPEGVEDDGFGFLATPKGSKTTAQGSVLRTLSQRTPPESYPERVAESSSHAAMPPFQGGAVWRHPSRVAASRQPGLCSLAPSG